MSKTSEGEAPLTLGSPLAIPHHPKSMLTEYLAWTTGANTVYIRHSWDRIWVGMGASLGEAMAVAGSEKPTRFAQMPEGREIMGLAEICSLMTMTLRDA